MKHNYLLLCFFATSAYFLAGSVADESIMGGTFAKLQYFRYQASIVSGNGGPHCGGGVIKDLFILTAAHCFINAHNQLVHHPVYVHVETVNLDEPGTVIEVEKVYLPKEFVHPDFNNTVGDIAVVKMVAPLQLKRHNLTLHLPKRKTANYTHVTARIAGFGWDKIVQMKPIMLGLNSNHRLRFADAEVRSYNKCKHEHPDRNIIENRHLCARIKQHQAGAYRGVCLDDGGGPLVLNEKLVIGIMSVSTIACRERESSAIYTNVAHYREFILHAMDDNVTDRMMIVSFA